jgi:hypothetical protein
MNIILTKNEAVECVGGRREMRIAHKIVMAISEFMESRGRPRRR